MYCPCYLAATGDCVLCSQFQGRDFCDCQWCGVCVYQLDRPDGDPPPGRRERAGTVTTRRELAPDSVLMTIATQRLNAESWSSPGTFVFLKKSGYPQAFYAPVSLLWTEITGDRLNLTALVEALGPKTRAIAEAARVDVRGPYWNGLFGRRSLDVARGARVLILARGPGQGAALNVATHVASTGAEITVVIDPARAGAPLFLAETRATGARVLVGRLDPPLPGDAPDRGLNIENLMRETVPGLVVSCGADWLHHRVGQTMERIGLRAPMVFTNNRALCCGEGVCGSCLLFTSDGEPVRTCKADLGAADWRRMRGEFREPLIHS